MPFKPIMNENNQVVDKPETKRRFFLLKIAVLLENLKYSNLILELFLRILLQI